MARIGVDNKFLDWSSYRYSDNPCSPPSDLGEEAVREDLIDGCMNRFGAGMFDNAYKYIDIWNAAEKKKENIPRSVGDAVNGILSDMLIRTVARRTKLITSPSGTQLWIYPKGLIEKGGRSWDERVSDILATLKRISKDPAAIAAWDNAAIKRKKGRMALMLKGFAELPEEEPVSDNDISASVILNRPISTHVYTYEDPEIVLSDSRIWVKARGELERGEYAYKHDVEKFYRLISQMPREFIGLVKEFESKADESAARMNAYIALVKQAAVLGTMEDRL
jgi:hypothetical protein